MPAAPHPRQVGLAELGGHAALPLPQAPGDRGGGQALGPALCGERVEEGVGGGVVGLAGAAEQARRPRRRGRRRRGRAPRSARAGARRRRPWGRRPRSSARRSSDSTVPSSSDPGAVDDRAEGVLLGDRGEQLFELRRGRRRRRRRSSTSAPELLRARPAAPAAPLGLGAAAADQEQVAGAVRLDQVAGDEGAEAAGGAGDQDGALGVDRLGASVLLVLGRGRAAGTSSSPSRRASWGSSRADGQRRLAAPPRMPRCRRCRSGRSGRGARTGPSGPGPRRAAAAGSGDSPSRGGHRALG